MKITRELKRDIKLQFYLPLSAHWATTTQKIKFPQKMEILNNVYYFCDNAARLKM